MQILLHQNQRRVELIENFRTFAVAALNPPPTKKVENLLEEAVFQNNVHSPAAVLPGDLLSLGVCAAVI